MAEDDREIFSLYEGSNGSTKCFYEVGKVQAKPDLGEEVGARIENLGVISKPRHPWIP